MTTYKFFESNTPFRMVRSGNRKKTFCHKGKEVGSEIEKGLKIIPTKKVSMLAL